MESMFYINKPLLGETLLWPFLFFSFDFCVCFLFQLDRLVNLASAFLWSLRSLMCKTVSSRISHSQAWCGGARKTNGPHGQDRRGHRWHPALCHYFLRSSPPHEEEVLAVTAWDCCEFIFTRPALTSRTFVFHGFVHYSLKWSFCQFDKK